MNFEEIYVIKVKPPPERIYTTSSQRFPSEIGQGLGITHIILGCISIILETVGLIMAHDRTRIGSGIWCGLVFILTGVAGILSWKFWYQKRKICAFFVLSVISGTLATVLLILTAISIAESYTYYNTTSGRRIDGNIVVLSVLELITSVISSMVSGGGIFSCMIKISAIENQASVTRTKVVVSTNAPHYPENRRHIYANFRSSNTAPDVLATTSDRINRTLTLNEPVTTGNSKMQRLQTYVQQAQELVNNSQRYPRHFRDVVSSNDDFSSDNYDSESGYDA